MVDSDAGPNTVDENGYVTVPANEYEYIEIDGQAGPTMEGELNKCGLRTVGPTLELLDVNGVVVDDTIAGNNGYYRFRFENEGTKKGLDIDGTYSVRLVPFANNPGLQSGLADHYAANKCKPLPDAPAFSAANLTNFVPFEGQAAGGDAPVCGTTTLLNNSTDLGAAPNHVDLTLDYAGVCVAGSGSGSSAVGDRIWMDENKNGIQDPGELGVSGVTVNLYTSTGTLVATMQTDANGNYRFNGLDAGTYYIEFVLPNGVVVSPQNAGGDDATDSDINDTGRTGNFTLGVLDINLTVDGGVFIAPTSDPETGEPDLEGLDKKQWLPVIGGGF